MDIRWISCVLILHVCTASSEYWSPNVPEWPEVYKACVRFQSTREFLTTGWYVDSNNEWMRLDSYGVPSESNMTYLLDTDDEYACDKLGEPLYMYLYHYSQGLQFNIFPAPDPPYVKCTAMKIPKTFPPNPLLPGIQFVRQARDNVTTFDHWKAEYFLFTLDYFFHTETGLPYKMYVETELFEFLSIESGPLDESVFMLPQGVKCTWEQS
ncbi:unnamed protein product [Mytilus coruscus]|uniref:Uncharacterized protein n=1 Tax=Mytilus coruscus TaxID=42192 RepID=A0A6J8A7I6_MYTCO|nr:unnamed protein product [Mytilus coruscus]